MSPADQVREQGWCLLPALLNEQELVALRAAFADEGRGHTEHVDVTDATPHADLWRSLADRGPLAGLVADLLGDRGQLDPVPVSVSVHGRNPRPGGGDQGLHADQPAAPGGIRAIIRSSAAG